MQYPFFSSSHSFIFISIKFSAHTQRTYCEFKDYNRIDFSSINQQFNLFDSTPIFTTNDVDQQLSVLDGLVYELHALVPTRRTRSYSYRDPWMNSSEIYLARSNRDIAYGDFLRNRTENNWKAYCILRNRAKAVIRRARSSYGERLFSESNNSKLWRNIRKLGAISPPDSDRNVLDVEEIARVLSNNFGPNNCDPSLLLANSNDYIGSFSFNPVTEFDLYMALNSIKSNSVGHYFIP